MTPVALPDASIWAPFFHLAPKTSAVVDLNSAVAEFAAIERSTFDALGLLCLYTEWCVE